MHRIVASALSQTIQFNFLPVSVAFVFLIFYLEVYTYLQFVVDFVDCNYVNR